MSLCRLNTVARARKSPGKCGRCGVAIDVGQPYRWWQGRFTGKYVRCSNLACFPQPWELETNALKAEAMEGEHIMDEAQRCTEDAETAASHLRDALATCESISEQLQERIDNMTGTGLENTEQYSTLEETLFAYESWRDSAESVADELEALDPAPDVSAYDATAYPADYDPEQAAQDAYDAALATYVADVEDVLSQLEDWPELDLGAYGPPRPRRSRKS